MTEQNTALAVNSGAPPNEAEPAGKPTHEADPDVEKRARRMGYRSEEDFPEDAVNKPKKFLSPEEYIEKVETDLPILRERNRFLDNHVGRLEGKITESTSHIKGLNDRLGELTDLVDSLHDQNIEVGKRAYERGRRELESIMEEAVVEADPEKYRQAKTELDTLEKHRPVEPPEKPQEPAPQAAPAAEQQITPAVQSFVDDNPWFSSDPGLNGWMIKIHDKVVKEMAGEPEYKQLAESKQRLQKKFPEEFPDYQPKPTENPRRDAPASVAGASSPEPRSKKKSFDSLPADVKQTYERLAAHWKRKGKTYTKEQYTKNYFLNLEEST